MDVVVFQLNSKWNKWYKSASFECKADGKFLQIMASEYHLLLNSLKANGNISIERVLRMRV